MGSTWALHGAPQMATARGDTSGQAMLPWEVFTHLLTCNDATYETAFAEGSPTALLLKDLKFVSVGDVNIVRPRQTGSLHFIKHCKVCPRVVNLAFDVTRIR